MYLLFFVRLLTPSLQIYCLTHRLLLVQSTTVLSMCHLFLIGPCKVESCETQLVGLCSMTSFIILS